MPEPEFDPRLAALTHTAQAERMVEQMPGTTAFHPLGAVIAQAATGIACGLIYVGDQVARVADERDEAARHLRSAVQREAMSRRVSR